VANHRIDRAGQRYGLLVAIAPGPPGIPDSCGKSASTWLCDCDCGTKNYAVITVSLARGRTRSCGCLKRLAARRCKWCEQRIGISRTLSATSLEASEFCTEACRSVYFDDQAYEKEKQNEGPN